MADNRTKYLLTKKLQQYFSFPVWCFCCQKFIPPELISVSSYLCSRCYEKLPFSEKALCSKCGLKHNSTGCRSKWASEITQYNSIFNYQEPISGWISNLKYYRNMFAGKILQQFVTHWFNHHQVTLKSIDFLLPVPLHISRLQWRSFNQTVFLLNKQQHLPVNIKVLKRIRKTPHQAGLNKKSRNQNMANAFKVDRCLSNYSILIFDDVCTTGTTIGEICQELKTIGVKKIHVLTLARVI